MNLAKLKKIILPVFEVFQILAALAFAVAAGIIVYYIGYSQGYAVGVNETIVAANQAIARVSSNYNENSSDIAEPTPTVIYVNRSANTPNWSGPELWEEVNSRRSELGVNPLGQRDELCTIASIRLNELLDLGDLDGHEGFSTLPERREDLKWIYEKYNLSEFLLYGAQTPKEAVSLWENTLGHKKLLTGGEYVWGCIYAQNTYAVAITAY